MSYQQQKIVAITKDEIEWRRNKNDFFPAFFFPSLEKRGFCEQSAPFAAVNCTEQDYMCHKVSLTMSSAL